MAYYSSIMQKTKNNCIKPCSQQILTNSLLCRSIRANKQKSTTNKHNVNISGKTKKIKNEN